MNIFKYMQEQKTTNKYNFFKDYQNIMLTINELSKTAENPFFKSKYVELKIVLSEVKKVCLANNFIFIQIPDVVENTMVLKTILRHITGEEIVGCIHIVAKDNKDPQKVGAGLTYMRRYSLTTLFGIQEEDDDGNTASKTNNVTDTVLPFSNQSYSNPMKLSNQAKKVEGEICPQCNVGKMVKNPKTGKIFCADKCWLKSSTKKPTNSLLEKKRKIFELVEKLGCSLDDTKELLSWLRIKTGITALPDKSEKWTTQQTNEVLDKLEILVEEMNADVN